MAILIDSWTTPIISKLSKYETGNSARSLGAHISRRPDLQLRVVWDSGVWGLISADVQIFSYEWYGIQESGGSCQPTSRSSATNGIEFRRRKWRSERKTPGGCSFSHDNQFRSVLHNKVLSTLALSIKPHIEATYIDIHVFQSSTCSAKMSNSTYEPEHPTFDVFEISIEATKSGQLLHKDVLDQPFNMRGFKISLNQT